MYFDDNGRKSDRNQEEEFGFKESAGFVDCPGSGGSIAGVAADDQEMGQAGKIAGDQDKFAGRQKVPERIGVMAAGNKSGRINSISSKFKCQLDFGI